MSTARNARSSEHDLEHDLRPRSQSTKKGENHVDKLLAVYEEIIRAASDDQILAHLTNFLTDVKDLELAVQQIAQKAKERATQPQ
jgi:hypothetical protein